WTPSSANTGKEIRVTSGLTHEEMAQMIGASRETATRLLSDLRKKQLIRLEGSTLVIRNRMALEAMASYACGWDSEWHADLPTLKGYVESGLRVRPLLFLLLLTA